MNFLTVFLMFGFFLLAVTIRVALPEDKKLWSIPALLVLFVVWATIIMNLKIEDKTPQIPYYPMEKRAPQSEVAIDIVDSRTDKGWSQIIIYYRGCVDRLNVRNKDLTDKTKLNKAVDKILDLRDSTGGCK